MAYSGAQTVNSLYSSSVREQQRAEIPGAMKNMQHNDLSVRYLEKDQIVAIDPSPNAVTGVTRHNCKTLWHVSYARTRIQQLSDKRRGALGVVLRDKVADGF
jgi:hypothetical protein